MYLKLLSFFVSQLKTSLFIKNNSLHFSLHLNWSLEKCFAYSFPVYLVKYYYNAAYRLLFLIIEMFYPVNKQ